MKIRNKIPKISIIIPAYNTQDYIYKCIDSIVTQDLVDIEIIIVIDGATDKTEQVARYFEKQDERVNVISISNSGAGLARNVGLKKSNGKYVIFLDSDDWLSKEALFELYNRAEEKKADIVCFGYNRVFENGKIIDETKNKSSFYDSIDLFNIKVDELDDNILNLYGKGVSNKLIKRSVLESNNIEFEQDRQTQAEDLYVSYLLLFSKPKIEFINKPFYNYVQHRNSSLHRDIIGIGNRYLQLFDRIYENIKEDDKYIFEPLVSSLAFYMMTFICSNWYNNSFTWFYKEISKYKDNQLYIHLMKIEYKRSRGKNESMNMYIVRKIFCILFSIGLYKLAFYIIYIRIAGVKKTKYRLNCIMKWKGL